MYILYIHTSIFIYNICNEYFQLFSRIIDALLCGVLFPLYFFNVYCEYFVFSCYLLELFMLFLVLFSFFAVIKLK